jgi:exonuclease VII large subunit
VVSRADGSLVRSVSQVKAGDEIQVQMADGKFSADVTQGEG